MIKSPLMLLSAWSTWFRYPTLGSSRLREIFFFSWFMSIGLLFASRGIPQLTIFLKALGVIISITIFVYSLNDNIDANRDKLSRIKSKRPIPSGMMTKRQALLLSIVGGLIGVSLSLTINYLTTIFALGFMSLGFSYSVPPIRLKQRFLMKEITSTIGMLISILIGSAVVERIPSSLFLPSFFFILNGLTFNPAFDDALDIREDEQEGCKTIAMILSQKTRLELATFSVFITMVIITLAYGYFNLNIICPILTVFASLLFLRYLFPFLLKPEEIYNEEIIKKSSSISKVFGLIVIFGFILGSLPLYN